MQLTSSAFKHGKTIPKKYTCQGKDISPPLKIQDIPADAKSLALIVDDPDAPSGLWKHWLVHSIDTSTTEIKENAVPDGAYQVINDFGKKEYGGPCPPSGTHRYFFKLFALDVDHLENATKKNFYQLIDDHKIEEAELMGNYKKK